MQPILKIARAPAASRLAQTASATNITQVSKRTTTNRGYSHPTKHDQQNTFVRTLDEDEYIKGRDEERKELSDKLTNLRKMSITERLGVRADQFLETIGEIYYRKHYSDPSLAFIEHFYSVPWCRMIIADGLPGSGHEQFSKDLAEYKSLKHVPEADLYYTFKRKYHNNDFVKELSENYKNGGIGNWFEEKLPMSWEKLYENPSDWKMASRVLAWQVRATRVMDSDITRNHLAQRIGSIQNSSFISSRAQIHAFGETGLIPKNMYESMLSYHKYLEKHHIVPCTIMILDISPEEAHANIQKSDNYSESAKKFYTIEYLKAFKEGYDEFVVSHMEEHECLILRVTPEDVKDLPQLVFELEMAHPLMVNELSYWGEFVLPKGPTFKRWYNMMNSCISDSCYQYSPYTGKLKYHPKQGEGRSSMDTMLYWKFPNDCVDPGWDWDRVQYTQEMFMEKLKPKKFGLF